MTLLEIDKVDIIMVKNGIPELTVVDHGQVAGEERVLALRSKLTAYGQFIVSTEFQNKYENWKNSRIVVVCSVEPTQEMRQFYFLEIGFEDSGSLKIPVCL